MMKILKSSKKVAISYPQIPNRYFLYYRFNLPFLEASSNEVLQ